MPEQSADKGKRSPEGRPTSDTYRGINRRATALLPPPQESEGEKFYCEDYHDYRKLLLSIEAKQRTGCLRIDSETNKSRSGILTFRGRVLGCVYRNRAQDQYFFDQTAYENAINDLASADRVIDAYVLQENLAIATASLFHGHILEVPHQAGAVETFKLTQGYLVESKLPGCIVVSSIDDQSMFMTYFFEGKIIGVYSIKDGWLENSYAVVKNYLEHCHAAKAQACILSSGGDSEVLRYTFSLSGLADRSVQAWAGREENTIPNVFYLCNHDSRILSRCENVVPLDRFIPRWSAGKR